MADTGQIVLGKFIGGLLLMEGWLLDQLPIMKGYTLEDKAWPVNRIAEVFISEVNC